MQELLHQLAFHGEGEVKMPNPEIEEFARILVREVRDAAVRNCDGLLRPNAGSPVAKRWRESGGQGASPGVVIPDTVDETVFWLLHTIDEGLLRMKFVSGSGREVDLTKDGLGELSGWYMASGGWRAMYSEERFVDDCADPVTLELGEMEVKGSSDLEGKKLPEEEGSENGKRSEAGRT